MIYEPVNEDEPIRQGDIFTTIPLVRFDPGKLAVARPPGRLENNCDWLNELNAGAQSIRAMVDINPVDGIVISQDCDAARESSYIAFFQIQDFEDVVRQKPNSLKAWVSVLTQHARASQKWFYLPPDENYAFETRKAVDFNSIIPIPRAYLATNIKTMRRGRLNEIAYQHFREKIAQYFRRFPYDEWYSLNKEELAKYKENPSRKDSKPFPWQE